MNPFWSKLVDGLTPYVPGEQPRVSNLIKLNTNENPYGPSPKALEAVREQTTDSLRLYPDPASDKLREAIATCHGVAQEQVFVGNGSDEVLGHTFQALLKHDAPILIPDISYSFYPVYCRLFGIEYSEVALTDSFEIVVDDYLRANGGIVLPNPNAPTGRLLAITEIERLLRANADSVVVIDEAYIDFGGDTAVPLVAQHRNLLVTRTLSKSYSLAGLRIGYAVGHPELIEALNRVKDSFNSYPLDRLAEAAAVAAIQDRPHVDSVCRRIIASRSRLATRLEKLGFEVVPSAANFVFVRYPGREGADLTASLRDRGIIVRHFANPPRISAYMRISIGTDEQCDALVSALEGMVS